MKSDFVLLLQLLLSNPRSDVSDYLCGAYFSFPPHGGPCLPQCLLPSTGRSLSLAIKRGLFLGQVFHEAAGMRSFLTLGEPNLAGQRTFEDGHLNRLGP